MHLRDTRSVNIYGEREHFGLQLHLLGKKGRGCWELCMPH